MMLMIIMVGTMLLMLATLAYTMGSSAALENGVYYMGITLPAKWRGEEVVKSIRAEYQRSWRRISLVGFAAGLAIFLFYDYVSLQVVSLMTWFFALMYVYRDCLKRYGWKLYHWKIEQEWYRNDNEGGQVRRIDTTLTSSRHSMPVRLYWGIAPMLCVMYCVYRYLTAGFSVVSACFAACSVMFLAQYFVIVRSRTKVYCDDSRVNVEINKSIKYEWSRCMLLHSGMAALIALVLAFLSTKDLPAMVKGSSYLLIMLCTAGSMFTMFVADRNVRKVKNQADFAKYYDEDDIYYLLGKRNPNAPRVQEKRLGIGFEINAGNEVETVIVALTMVFVIGMAIFLSRYDFADITTSFKEEAGGRVQVRVVAADERDSFYVDEITEIELLENYPRMSKNNGYDGTVYNIGAFNVSGYGKCRTYVCLKTKPAIIVRTQDKTYLLNDESEAGTRELYDRLVEACGKGVQ